jgi:hypothetical protein
MTYELKFCPMCGTNTFKITERLKKDSDGVYKFHDYKLTHFCTQPSIVSFTRGTTKEEVIENWNAKKVTIYKEIFRTIG